MNTAMHVFCNYFHEIRMRATLMVSYGEIRSKFDPVFFSFRLTNKLQRFCHISMHGTTENITTSRENLFYIGELQLVPN